MLWFTADHHFWHEEVIACFSRPFKTSQEMNQELIRRHNSLVAAGDTVFLLGDLILFGPRRESFVSELIKSLRGNKILILGNHDYLDPFDYVRMGFQSVHTVLEVNGLILVHDPGMYNTDIRAHFLCGHVHTLFKRRRNIINVGVDVWDFEPVSYDTILGLINNR